MKAVMRNLLPVAAVLFLLQLAAGQTPKLSPFTADMQMTSTRTDRGPSDMTGKLFVGSGHLRLNMGTAGHQTAVITDFATQTSDILMVDQQMYIESKAGQPGRGPGRITQDLKSYDPENPCASQPDWSCKKIGVEEINGRTCDHWEVTDKQGKVSNFWIDQKLHFPVKLVTQDSTITLSNIQEGEPDASLFQVPAGFHKMDIDGMLPPGMSAPPHQ